jgi:hypothetical protein
MKPSPPSATITSASSMAQLPYNLESRSNASEAIFVSLDVKEIFWAI